MTPIIETIALRKCFGATRALHSLDLQVVPGEVFCLLGANGAGKSTTLNLLLGFLTPTSSTARIAGLDVNEHPIQTKRHLAYVPEQVTLYERLSGLENLRSFLTLAGRDLPAAALREHLIGAGLAAECHGWPARTYSKGMRQKVALAMARGASALLLDEPTSGLDPKAANELSVVLRRLSAAGAAVLMATHDLFRVKEVSCCALLLGQRRAHPQPAQVLGFTRGASGASPARGR